MNERILNILLSLRPENDFSGTANYFESGLLDSFDLVSLIATLDKDFGISIKGTDIVPENFCSLEAIIALLKQYGVS